MGVNSKEEFEKLFFKLFDKKEISMTGNQFRRRLIRLGFLSNYMSSNYRYDDWTIGIIRKGRLFFRLMTDINDGYYDCYITDDFGVFLEVKFKTNTDLFYFIHTTEWYESLS